MLPRLLSNSWAQLIHPQSPKIPGLQVSHHAQPAFKTLFLRFRNPIRSVCECASPYLSSLHDIPCMYASLITRLKFLLNSMIFSSTIYWFLLFVLSFWWKLDLGSPDYSILWYLLLHLFCHLTNNRYWINVCSKSELGIKDVRWKYYGSKLFSIYIKTTSKHY